MTENSNSWKCRKCRKCRKIMKEKKRNEMKEFHMSAIICDPSHDDFWWLCGRGSCKRALCMVRGFDEEHVQYAQLDRARASRRYRERLYRRGMAPLFLRELWFLWPPARPPASTLECGLDMGEVRALGLDAESALSPAVELRIIENTKIINIPLHSTDRNLHGQFLIDSN